MSEKTTAEKDICVTRTAACCLWPIVASIVFLRLCAGWHFFNEGVKKLEYDSGRSETKLVFSAEGFLNGAKGPLADFFQNQAPTTHQWRKSLAVSQKLDPAKSDKLQAWAVSYVKRRQEELKAGKSSEPQFSDLSPAASWRETIVADWDATLDRFQRIKGVSDETRKEAETLVAKYKQYLIDFLAEISLDVEAYQHNLWRLEQAKNAPEAGEVPFVDERITAQQAEVDRTPAPWVAMVKSFDADLADELSRLVASTNNKALIRQARTAVTDPEVQALARMNKIVTFVVTGVGVCLLLGLFTRAAALVGAMFLLSVMATQPPWVPDANTMVFYYQLVEFAALLFLAAVGAGRWAGLDFIIHGLWSRRRSAQGA